MLIRRAVLVTLGAQPLDERGAVLQAILGVWPCRSWRSLAFVSVHYGVMTKLA